MDFNYLVANDPKQVRRLEELGFDLDSLFFMTKDLFSIFDDLELPAREIEEFCTRLKNVYDVYEGKPFPTNIVLYENSRTLPTRLCVENKDTGKTVFFRLVPGQGKLEKCNVLYRCEVCRNDVPIKRCDTKRHIASKHNNLL
ncbi:unnamed protein product [Blepharisma stoltei]|uniref:C2H2-type domain-containing protein n=1 Tax=Blepharisma stoltei TaxID=1481888 RepID=A0AAU9JCW3_9CILI|nr:unnamed protein product [Blepharisma stoltei]